MAHSLHSQQPPESKHGEHNAPRKHTSVNALIGFVLVVIAAIFVMSVLFRVHDIRVEGNEHYTDEEIIKAIDIEDGDNLFFYDRIAAVSRALAKLPYIEEVSITRSLPDRITITVTESKAMAYLVVGDEDWTLDHNCKVLGKAADGEQDQLIPIVGFDPGTLLIGEQLTTGDGSITPVEYLAEILYQLQERGLASNVTRIDFSDPDAVKFSYGRKYTVILGSYSEVEYKFGMFVSVMEKLKAGDVGIINLSDTSTAHFSPN